MIEKKIKTRVQQKHDLEINWLKASAFIPMKGEFIVYDIEIDADGNTLIGADGNSALPEGRDIPYTYERFKIGDGKTNINDLPFFGLNDFNLANGAGIASIVMKTGENPDVDYVNGSEGPANTLLGDGNYSYGTSAKKNLVAGTKNLLGEEGVNKSVNSNTVSGQLNELKTGSANIIGGYKNKIESSNFSLINGQSNTVGGITSTKSIVSGTGNAITYATDSLINGNSNIVKFVKQSIISGNANRIGESADENTAASGARPVRVFGDINTIEELEGNVTIIGNSNISKSNSFVFGDDNTTGKNSYCVGSGNDSLSKSNTGVIGNDNIVASNSVVVGNNNKYDITKNVSTHYVFGYNNNATGLSTQFLLGHDLVSNSGDQIVIGKFNDRSNISGYQVLFGCGDDESARKNAFGINRGGGFTSLGNSAVYGKLSVSSTPKEADDVVRLGDIVTTTNADIDTLFRIV